MGFDADLRRPIVLERRILRFSVRALTHEACLRLARRSSFLCVGSDEMSASLIGFFAESFLACPDPRPIGRCDGECPESESAAHRSRTTAALRSRAPCSVDL